MAKMHVFLRCRHRFDRTSEEAVDEAATGAQILIWHRIAHGSSGKEPLHGKLALTRPGFTGRMRQAPISPSVTRSDSDSASL